MAKNKQTSKKLTKVALGSVPHNELDASQLVLARWTYQRAGKYLQPTFEQWELGFLRDTYRDNELATWVIVSLALESRIRECPHAMKDADCLRYVGVLSGMSFQGSRPPEEGSQEDRKLYEDAKRRFDAARKIYRKEIDRILAGEGLAV